MRAQPLVGLNPLHRAERARNSALRPELLAVGAVYGWGSGPQCEHELSAMNGRRAGRGPGSEAMSSQCAGDGLGAERDLYDAHAAVTLGAHAEVGRKDSFEQPGPRVPA